MVSPSNESVATDDDLYSDDKVSCFAKLVLHGQGLVGCNGFGTRNLLIVAA